MSSQDFPSDERDQQLRDRVEALSYPITADDLGTASINWQGVPFFFGRHNSPESYVEFCEWRRVLAETGEAPLVKDVRIDLSHRAHSDVRFRPTVKSPDEIYAGTSAPTRWKPSLRWAVGAMLAAVATAGVWKINLNGQIDSTGTTGFVDGTPLTDTEAEVVRGVREFRAKRDQELNARRVAELSSQFLDMDPLDAKFHAFPDAR